MMIDHRTRLSIAQEHQDRLRETMLASRRGRRTSDDGAASSPTAHVYTFPKRQTQLDRGFAA
jgi:hypothetical protein